MKRLILLTILVFVAVGVYVINLPPREMTVKDLQPVIIPHPVQEVIEISDTSSKSVTTNIVSHGSSDSIMKDPTVVASLPVEAGSRIEYYIIIGSMRDHSLARAEADKLKRRHSVEIIVLPPTAEGNYRLSYGRYASREEAKAVIESVKLKIRPDAWIFKLKK